MRSYLQQIHLSMQDRQAQQDELRRLRNEIEKRKLERDLAELNSPVKKLTRPERQTIDTYEVQLNEWYNRLPAEARRAPRTMVEFVNLLTGRTPGMNAHPADVSRILRRLGWTRKRNWKADGEGCRVWWPPGSLVRATTGG